MESLAVSLRSVVALVGHFPVLAGADLDVRRGEILSVTGPNGAGKTSLLRLIGGLLSISDGTGEVMGVDLRCGRTRLAELVGYVGHDAFAYDELTVRENIEFFAGCSANDAIETVGLGARADLVASKLSAGQRRRLGLATLIARQPRLWLLDEPHAGLDTQSKDMLAKVLRDATARGATVLFSAHEHSGAAEIATRNVEVRGGRIIDLATNDLITTAMQQTGRGAGVG